MLEVHLTGQRGRIATRGRNVLDDEKLSVISISTRAQQQLRWATV